MIKTFKAGKKYAVVGKRVEKDIRRMFKDEWPKFKDFAKDKARSLNGMVIEAGEDDFTLFFIPSKDEYYRELGIRDHIDIKWCKCIG